MSINKSIILCETVLHNKCIMRNVGKVTINSEYRFSLPNSYILWYYNLSIVGIVHSRFVETVILLKYPQLKLKTFYVILKKKNNY